MSTILYYASSHGQGHINRLKTLLPYLQNHTIIAVHETPAIEGYDNVINVFTSPLVHHEKEDKYKFNPACFHPIPLGDNTKHFVPVIKAIQTYKPNIAFVDVSVEVALLCRLMGVPFMYLRQTGNRHDLPHKIVYEAAVGIVACYTLPMEEVEYKYLKKTYYVGGLSRFHPKEGVKYTLPKSVKPAILVLPGRGGTNITPEHIISWAKRAPEYQWIPLCDGPINDYVKFVGYKSNVEQYIQIANVVVGNAGDNVVMEVGAYKKPFICIPAPRPFNEQYAKANLLSMMNVAEVCFAVPDGNFIHQLILGALNKDLHRWSEIVIPTAAAKFVESIELCIHQVSE